jgi:uncharacterized repeat protein (TIGR02543 family)
MRKKLHLLNAVLIFTALFLFGCQDTQTIITTTLPITTISDSLLHETREDAKIYSVYLLALNSGAYTGTYDEWLESVQGPKGDPGKQVLLRVNDNQLQWQYEDEPSWRTLFDLVTLAGGDGIGIESVNIDGNGDLIVTYTDDHSDNLGPILTVYSVEFRDESGALYSSQIVTIGGNAIPPTGINKTGYDFLGWTGNYENVRNNTTVVATFRPHTYTITFDSNGGSACGTLTEVVRDDVVSLPEPSKEGYRFLGWYRGESINSAPFHDSDSVTEDLELVARWELQTHAVCFMDEDNTLLLSMVVPHGFAAYLPINPVKQGYTFSEWDHDPMVIEADVIMRPLFTANNYTITFNSNGGSAVASLTLPYLSELPALSESERVGYRFLGWFTNTALTDSFALSSMPIGGLTLYAKWQILSFTINYDTQGGSEIEAKTLNYNTALSQPLDPFREFHDFVGWSTSPDMLVPFAFTTMPANDLTIYAIWKDASLQYALLDDETYAVSGVNPLATEVIIPSTYKGAAVTKILTGAFQNGALVTRLVIADSVTTMEAGCLAGLSALEYLSVPYVGITRDATQYDGTLGVLFGTEAFAGSTAITHYFPSIIRKSYVAPASLRTLLVTDADNLRAGSLSGLGMLTEIQISDGITTIEAGALALSLSLKSMTLPFIGTSLTATGTDALLGTIFGKSNFGVIATSYYQGSLKYYLPPALESLKITGGTYVNDSALMNLRSLREISLPMTITDIGNSAFYNDVALASIVLPDQLRRIGDYAFAYDPSILPSLNPALNAIVLPSSLRDVGNRVFDQSFYNEALVIYAMVSPTSIYSCWDTLDDAYEVVYNAQSIGVIEGLDYVDVEHYGLSILGVHFGNKASSIVIPEYLDPQDNKTAVTTIAPGAFAHNPYLEELWIKDNVHTVGKNAVGGSNLTVYLELPFVPEWWVTSSWNPLGVPVVLNATFPD